MSCQHTSAVVRMAQESLRDFMDVPDKKKDTKWDYSGFDIEVCAECGCPVALSKRVSLLENAMWLVALCAVFHEEDE